MTKNDLMFRLILLTIFLLQGSCKSNMQRFYDDYSKDDLFRIPIIYPYELIRPYGLEKNMGLTDSWDLKFRYGGDRETPGFFIDVMVSEINVSGGIIYGHDVKHGDYPDVWFVIIPQRKMEKVFKGRKNEWQVFLKKNGIETIKLHSVWELFDQFKNYSALPWYNSGKKDRSLD